MKFIFKGKKDALKYKLYNYFGICLLFKAFQVKVSLVNLFPENYSIHFKYLFNEIVKKILILLKR